MSADYRTVDDAIRDGWWISFGPGPAWWSVEPHRYHVTAKKAEYHVELAANSLARLRGAVRMLKSVPRDDIPFGRDYWSKRRRAAALDDSQSDVWTSPGATEDVTKRRCDGGGV
jgi:hypothetical protein